MVDGRRSVPARADTALGFAALRLAPMQFWTKGRRRARTVFLTIDLVQTGTTRPEHGERAP